MPLPVISVAQMRDWEERTWASGISEESVIAAAGLAVARAAMSATPEGATLILLAGPGKNGADTRIAAENITGRAIDLIDGSDPVSACRKFKQLLDQRPSILIDGLFGIGLNRPLDEDFLELVEAINSSGLPVLSVDCPSGFNCDTGEIMGDAIRANTTITLGGLKEALLNPSADEYVGRIVVADDIGLIEPAPEGRQLWLTDADMHSMPPRRALGSHKGTYGHLGIIAGNTGYHGAACLASRAALRARPGLLSVFTPAYNAVAAHLQEAMVHPWSPAITTPMSGCTAILAGPGLAGENLPDSLTNVVRDLWVHSDNPMIVDASALGWLPKGERQTEAVRVITPHPGEAARMLGAGVDEVQSDRFTATRRLAVQFDCTAVLKGRHTLIGQAEGPMLVNSTGNPGLGRGGSGDVLAGFLAAHLAQPQFQARSIQAIAYAAWKHGQAADKLESEGRYWGMDGLIDGLGEWN